MKSHQFYQAFSKQAISITLFTLEEYNAYSSFSEHERRVLASLQFGAKLGDVALIVNAQGSLDKVYIGAGESSDILAIAYAVMKLPAGSYQLTNTVCERAILAWSLAQYHFDVYQKVASMPRVLEINPKYLPEIIAQTDAVFMVRDLVNMPPNALNPESLAQAVHTLAETHQAQYHVWVGDELLTHNFPAIHAVGRAAASEPRLISLTWGDEAHPRVTLVGKGVCFDSGGLDLKNAVGMRLMKKDMGGAAHVMGLAHWLMTEKLPIRLQVLIPAVENAVSGNAYRPGDVLTMRNGMTVEIDNTDAEGRLVLADALVKACEHNPELIIDFATLTGAARVAVGTEIAAMFSNNDALASEVQEYGIRFLDPVWQLPLFAGYQCLFESRIADVANSSPSPYGGAIVAALFLQYFVQPEIDWLHFDIMAWNVCSRPGKPEGGEAMGLLAVGHYLLERYGLKRQ